MRKFNVKNPALFLTAAAVFLIVLSSLAARGLILDALRLPLRLGADFIADAKAITVYKFILNDNIKLRRENDRLKKEAAFFEELRSENQRLKELLNLKENLKQPGVLASVIAFDANNFSSAVVIDKGKSSGIAVADIVMAQAGLAGRIVEVSRATSKVMLLNDQASAVSATVQRTQDDGLACGTMLGGLLVRYLGKESTVACGDNIVTSGFTPNYPSGILIGTVTQVKDEMGGLGKYCVVKPAVNLRKIEEVLVILRD